jgi:hypothetical protein
MVGRPRLASKRTADRILERFRAKHALGLDPWVDTGSREKKRVKTRIQSPVPILSERECSRGTVCTGHRLT